MKRKLYGRELEDTSDAVAAGNALKAGEEVTQEQITAAAKAITDAIAALKNRPTTKPVALPEM